MGEVQRSVSTKEKGAKTFFRHRAIVPEREKKKGPRRVSATQKKRPAEKKETGRTLPSWGDKKGKKGDNNIPRVDRAWRKKKIPLSTSTKKRKKG